MPPTKKSHLQETSLPSVLPVLLLGVLLFALPASGDWLITQEQKMIETQGPWSVEGDTLTYTDAEGHEKKVPLAQINLVASEKLTAIKSARPVMPPTSMNRSGAQNRSETGTSQAGGATAEGSKAESDQSEDSKAESGEPKITLYMTSWCGYCRRTSHLLKALNASFVEKDIEQDPKAAEEYRQKAKGYTGIPVLDINGRIVKGFQAVLIRDLVEDLKRQEAAAASEAAGQ